MTDREWMQWCFPTLNAHENAIIVVARQYGFALFYPTVPSADEQARKTLNSAKWFLERDDRARQGATDKINAMEVVIQSGPIKFA